MFQFLYIIQEREFIRLNENIFKIGKTKQLNLRRFAAYPKNSNLLFYTICSDIDNIEKYIIRDFKQNFIHRIEFGNEYFEGEFIEMRMNMINIIHKYDKKNKFSIQNVYIKEYTTNNVIQDNTTKNVINNRHQIKSSNNQSFAQRCINFISKRFRKVRI